ncbi:prepilin peptidase [Rhizobium sp. SG2393]|uniref:A24 family peptidase n=1 Tax=Rhizobium sp. SG2393 TaxID=3276279 RepID=UPI003671C5FB
MLTAAIFVIFPLGLAFAAVNDLLTMTIPNRISLVLIASFLVIAPLSGFGAADIGYHLLAALIVFSGCFALFAINVMGGGDAKLLTAAALWYGYNTSLIEFLSTTALLGGFLTIIILIIRSQGLLIAATRLPLPAMLLNAEKIPYGIAIAGGGLMTYAASPLMHPLMTGAI